MMVTPDARSRRTMSHMSLTQFDVDASGRFVEEKDLRLVRERLGDQNAALHATRKGHDAAVLLVPQ